MSNGERSRRSARSLLCSALMCLPLVCLPGLAFAGEVEDISKLMQKGAYKEALTLVDKAVAAKPRDANLRFLKGVLLAQLDRKQEATGVFIALTQDFPQLAEPYNNLGVLLAGSGDYERARDALQKAIQASPNYATAHENLGDLYARLATLSYERATQLDAKNGKTRSKLTMARELTNSASTTQVAGGAAAPQASAKSPAQPTVVVSTAPTPVSAMPAGAASAGVTPADQAVLEAVQAWARAWSARDVAAYLAAYAPDFKPADGKSLQAWKGEREKRIADKKEIDIQVQEPRLKLEGSQATVSFVQLYSAGPLKSRDRKELLLIRQGDKWLIQRERTGA